jgi:hypothetical protein
MEPIVLDDHRAVAPVWRRSSALAAVESPSRVVLLHLDHVDVPARILEDTGAVIWYAIDGLRDSDAIVSAVAAAFDIDEASIHDQVEQFLDDLRAAELVEALASTPEAA